jgi:hypothetical protein
MGLAALLPSEGSRAADFCRPENQLPSAGFEPSSLGFSGNHANHLTTEVGCTTLPEVFCVSSQLLWTITTIVSPRNVSASFQILI